jgi:hypothetical protein
VGVRGKRSVLNRLIFAGFAHVFVREELPYSYGFLRITPPPQCVVEEMPMKCVSAQEIYTREFRCLSSVYSRRVELSSLHMHAAIQARRVVDPKLCLELNLTRYRERALSSPLSLHFFVLRSAIKHVPSLEAKATIYKGFAIVSNTQRIVIEGEL